MEKRMCFFNIIKLIYSFAIVLWELLHRTVPWEKMQLEEIKNRVTNEERPNFTITAVAWNQLPNSRPTTAQILVHPK